MAKPSIPARPDSDLPREQRLGFLFRRWLAALPTDRLARDIRLLWFARQATLIAIVTTIALYIVGIWGLLDDTIGLLLDEDSRATGTDILAKAIPTGIVLSVRPALGALQWRLERELRRRERVSLADAPSYPQEGGRFFTGALTALCLVTIGIAFLWPN